MRVALTMTKIDLQGKADCKQAGRTVLFQKVIGWQSSFQSRRRAAPST